MNSGLVEMFSGRTALVGFLGQTVIQPASLETLDDGPATITRQLIVWLGTPQLWAVLATAGGLWLLLPRRGRRGQAAGAFLTVIGLAMFVLQLRGGAGLSTHLLFWTLASITIMSAVAAITSRNPVYCAIWFALTLLGTAALFLLHGAQFLGVATVVVYAGAIVVTFLFVIMLAQSDGYAHYDRMSWGLYPAGVATLAGAGFLAVILSSLGDLSAVDTGPLRDQASAVVQQLVGRAGEGDRGDDSEQDSRDDRCCAAGAHRADRSTAAIHAIHVTPHVNR